MTFGVSVVVAVGFHMGGDVHGKTAEETVERLLDARDAVVGFRGRHLTRNLHVHFNPQDIIALTVL
jgi:hypothetical protein